MSIYAKAMKILEERRWTDASRKEILDMVDRNPGMIVSYMPRSERGIIMRYGVLP